MSIKQKSELKDPRISSFLLDSSSSKMQRMISDSEQNNFGTDPKNSQEISIHSNSENENNANLSILNNSNLIDEKKLVSSENNIENQLPEKIFDNEFLISSKKLKPFPSTNGFEDQIEALNKSFREADLSGEPIQDSLKHEVFHSINDEDKGIESKGQDKSPEPSQQILVLNSHEESLLLSFQKEIALLSEKKLIDEVSEENKKETESIAPIAEKDLNPFHMALEENNMSHNNLQDVEICQTEHKKNKDFQEDMENKIEFNFKNIKCPNHLKEDIIFICNAPDCIRKFICSHCLVDDLRQQTRHHIVHEAYLISYDQNFFKQEYEKFLQKKNNFDRILYDQGYLLLEQIESGEISTIVQKKYQSEVNEIESFVEMATTKSKDILSEYKGRIKENVAHEANFFVHDLLNNFVNLKDEFKMKSENLEDIQKKSQEIFSKNDESSNEKINFFLSLHYENQEESLYQKFYNFLQNSMKTMKEYTSKESNKALKYEFYVNLMNNLKTMINEKIPKNLLNSKFSLLLKTKMNLSREDEAKEKEKEKKNEKNVELEKNSKNNIILIQPNANENNQNGAPKEIIEEDKSQKNDFGFSQIEKINSKYFYDLDYSLVLDICLIGPTDKNEYYVATCCSREKFIKIWTLLKDKPPIEYKNLEGHNKSTYKLFYCHEKKWLLSAGMDGSVKSWDISKNFEVGIYYKEERDPVNSIAYNSSFDLFASSHTLFTRIWKIRKEYFVKIEADYAIFEPTDLLLLNFPNSTDDRCRLVIGNEKGEIYFCDYVIGKSIRPRREPIRAHKKSVWKLVFNQSRKYVISCCKDDNTIIFWDPYNMDRLEEFTFAESKMIKGFFWNQEREEILISTGNNQIFFLEWHNNEHQIRRIYESEQAFGYNEMVFLSVNDLKVLVVYTNERRGMKNSYFIKYIYF